MKDELKSSEHNDVWELVKLSNSKSNIEWYRAILVAKGFTQQDGIDYK